MSTKKFLACLLASAMICGALASCGDSDDSKDSKDTSSAADTSDLDDAEEENAGAEESEAETAEAEESDEAEEPTAEPEAVAIDDVEFEDAVVAESGDAYLAIVDEQWWIQYWGEISDGTKNQLTYDAGVVHIDGNGDYTVSVTADTNGFRFDTTGDVNDQYVPAGLGFAAVIIKDGETAVPDAIITINSVKVDGNEIELTKKGYTNTEDGGIRSNIYNPYVGDDALPGDARIVDGALFNDYDSASPSELNDGGYSAQIVDTSAFNEWTTVEVNFTVSGL